MKNSENEISIFEGILYLLLVICVITMLIGVTHMLGDHEGRIRVLEGKHLVEEEKT